MVLVESIFYDNSRSKTPTLDLFYISCWFLCYLLTSHRTVYFVLELSKPSHLTGG